jgi:hypothetical protein
MSPTTKILATPDDAGRVAVRVRFGEPYLYLPDLAGVPGAPPHAGERYAPLRLARDCRTLQEQVVYEGLDGTDRGEGYTCSLSDWDLKFRPAAPEPAAPAGKAITVTEGPGY